MISTRFSTTGGVVEIAGDALTPGTLAPGVEVVVLEAAPAIGGKLARAVVGGVRVDVGAEAMLHRRPEGVRLARDAGCGAWWESSINAGKGSDLSIMLYTSGTTGRPKGVMLTYENLIVSAINGNHFDNLGPDEQVIAYLPLAWVG